ncbi:glyoxalase superfamily protein [Flammeovirgaceae bacterium 311]|nr:glyoxalase superfamily protein [Flammeovirgaceae bacterium 311]
MVKINRVHHIAIICSDYEKSKSFYTDVLGFEILKETFRQERNSFKLDLGLQGHYIIELFSFPEPPQRVSRPEASGLRHLAFEVDDVVETVAKLKKSGISAEEIRTDELTNKKFTFISDPDKLPIEFYEK